MYWWKAWSYHVINALERSRIELLLNHRNAEEKSKIQRLKLGQNLCWSSPTNDLVEPMCRSWERFWFPDSSSYSITRVSIEPWSPGADVALYINILGTAEYEWNKLFCIAFIRVYMEHKPMKPSFYFIALFTLLIC